MWLLISTELRDFLALRETGIKFFVNLTLRREPVTSQLSKYNEREKWEESMKERENKRDQEKEGKTKPVK